MATVNQKNGVGVYNKLLGRPLGNRMKTVKGDGGDMTGVTVNRFVGGKPRVYFMSSRHIIFCV